MGINAYYYNALRVFNRDRNKCNKNIFNQARNKLSICTKNQEKVHKT